MGIIRLPPFKVNRVITTLSAQTIPWGIKQNNIPDTWKITKGDGIKVMVIDTGYTNHSDLIGCTSKELSRSFVDGETYIDDENGHSTHCTGIIGARDNEFGMVGVAPEATIINCKVLGKDGFGSDDNINNALMYALEIKPDVISMSLGGPSANTLTHRLIQGLKDLNIPVIAAAGNEGSQGMGYPALFPETIAIAAYDKNGNIARFSSVGEEVDFAAPGVDIYSTWLKNSYASLQGTSMATPFMAGVVALLIAKHRKQEKETGKNDCTTVEEIRQHLLKYSNRGVIGRDNSWGYGIVDINKLIVLEGTDNQLVPPPVEPAPKPRKKSWWRRFLDKF